jgi:hypothetical protein
VRRAGVGMGRLRRVDSGYAVWLWRAMPPSGTRRASWCVCEGRGGGEVGGGVGIGVVRKLHE